MHRIPYLNLPIKIGNLKVNISSSISKICMFRTPNLDLQIIYSFEKKKKKKLYYEGLAVFIKVRQV